MHGNIGDEPPPSGSLMPPALTQRDGERPSVGDARLAPPFVGGPTSGPRAEVPETVQEISAVAAPRDEDVMPWDAMPDDGVVEPMFEADTDAVLAELSEHAKKDEFPLDAFIIPEQSQRVPSGLEGKPLPSRPEHTPLTALADRLEKLSHRLRVEDTEIMVRRLAGGDKLDALLAGLLAGYLAGSE